MIQSASLQVSHKSAATPETLETLETVILFDSNVSVTPETPETESPLEST
jgi:hypothetical protein